VQPTLGYALSQRNNHAISELVFLITVLGPDHRLCRLLTEVLGDQFYPDGSYAQQSFTYQRLAVQSLQWLLVTRSDLRPGLRARVVDAVARSREFLSRCSDPVSGWLPNYGANDGALLFALDDAHYRDFRPLLASLGRVTEVSAPSETAVWLGLDELADRTTDSAQQPSTYVTLAGPAIAAADSGRYERAPAGSCRPACRRPVDRRPQRRSGSRDLPLHSTRPLG
jgi:hypothetical protein